MKKPIVFTVLALHAITAVANCPSWPTAERFTFNGAEVTDNRTGLVWARCSVGQSWNIGTCTGYPSTFTHQAALQHAANQSGWRLPNRRELFSLLDKGCSGPAIDSIAFPNTASTGYWTSSPKVSYSSDAWYVDFGNGYVGDSDRDNKDHVRLVRASQ